MARVTVEDCLKNVKNRFELVILAAKRARQLMHGKEPMVEWDNDKATVVALREIAAGHTDFTHQEQNEEELPTINLQLSIEKAAEKVVIEEDEEDDIAAEGTTASSETPNEEHSDLNKE